MIAQLVIAVVHASDTIAVKHWGNQKKKKTEINLTSPSNNFRHGNFNQFKFANSRTTFYSE